MTKMWMIISRVCLAILFQKNKRLHPSNQEQGASMSSNCKFSLQQLAEYYRSPGMRIILLFTPLIWFLQSFVYLGLAINANNFARQG